MPKIRTLVRSAILAVPTVFVRSYERAVASMRPALKGVVCGHIVDDIFTRTEIVHHNNIDLRLSCPNSTTVFRARTFSQKEPETLEWVDGFMPDSVFWDIGANVGLYSIYAGLRHSGLRVFCFEPSVLNVELLARNIVLNGVKSQLCIVPTPLSDKSGPSVFRLGKQDRGGALSAFGVDFGYDGRPIIADLDFELLGFAADDLLGYGVPPPNYIKLDVDGIEHLILRGAGKILANRTVRSVLVEVNDDFAEQRDQVAMILTASGFRLRQHSHGKMFDNSVFGNTFNNIWVR